MPALAVEELRYMRDASGNKTRLVVEDPSGYGGKAQAALLGRSEPGDVASFYCYVRPAGRYRVVFRMKVGDNTVKDVVAQLSVHEETGRPGYRSGSLQVRGVDFQKPKEWQEFEVFAEKPEGSFLNIRTIWTGKADLWVDWIRTTSVELFKDSEIVRRAGGPKAPDVWAFPPAPFRVHLAKGLWWNLYCLTEAIASIGGAQITESFMTRGQYGYGQRAFPASYEAIASNHVIVLAAIHAQGLGPTGRVLLQEFVTHGGGVFVLGGWHAFACGQYKGTALEEILPVALTGAGDWDRVASKDGLVLKPGKDAGTLLPNDLPWSQKPRVFYYHDVAANPSARVLIEADGHPLLVVGECGKGRVAAFAGTVLGEPNPGQLPFWEWDSWPRVVAAVLRWLQVEHQSPPPPTASEEDRAALSNLASPAAHGTTAEREKLLRRLAGFCRDREFARELVWAVALLDGSPSLELVSTVAESVLPYVDAEMDEAVDQLLKSSDAAKVALALRILGRRKTADAGQRLGDFACQGIELLKAAPGEEGALPAGPEPSAAGSCAIRLAALRGIADRGDATLLPLLQDLTKDLAKQTQAAGVDTSTADQWEEVWQQAILTRWLLGDSTAAGPLFDMLLALTDEIKRHQNALLQQLYEGDIALEAAQKRARRRLPVIVPRLSYFQRSLDRTPKSVYGALAADMAKRNDPRSIPFAYSALAQSTGSTDAASDRVLLPLVTDCRLTELRTLGACRLAGAGQNLTLLAETLDKLAQSPHGDDARFAVRQIYLLPPGKRRDVVARALTHSDARAARAAVRAIFALPEPDRAALLAEARKRAESDPEIAAILSQP